MATALSNGYIYFIESDAGDNQNWVTDPDNIDLDNFTEGTDYCVFPLPTKWMQVLYNGIAPSRASSGTGFMERTYRRGSIVTLFANDAVGNCDNIEKFLQNDRHTASSPSTYTVYYLVIRRAASDYVLFTDNSGTQREYLKGTVPDGMAKFIWSNPDPLRASFDIIFFGGW